eukprot:TRINITY_DN24666_c0_g3_i1.p1 TRINITY_DN24666_c0_g3~~TRINITY_DN24666_c0_g3_i1.p1  ORF type:complete len:369 (+),score=66.66 TRINITY_DN24666_c0_g3_i1:103-1209(+)
MTAMVEGNGCAVLPTGVHRNGVAAPNAFGLHDDDGGTGPIAALRRLEAFFPIRAVLGGTGSVCLLWGAGWATATLIRQHPYLVLIVMGLVCLLASMLASPAGLISYLPRPVQDYLLHTSMFDFWIDDSAIKSWVRRWGRIQLLCSDRSEAEVEVLVRGLDPAFVEQVMRRSLVHWLPLGWQTALLPTPLSIGGGKADRAATVVDKSGSPVATDRTPATSSPAAMTAAEIVRHVRERRKAKDDKIVEPGLTPVVVATLMLGLDDAKKNLSKWASVGFAAASVWWAGAAAFLGWRATRPLVLAGLSRGSACVASFGLLPHSWSLASEAVVDRSAKVAAAFSVLSLFGVGGAVLLYSPWRSDQGDKPASPK